MRPDIDVSPSLHGKIQEMATERNVTTEELYRSLLQQGVEDAGTQPGKTRPLTGDVANLVSFQLPKEAISAPLFHTNLLLSDPQYLLSTGRGETIRLDEFHDRLRRTLPYSDAESFSLWSEPKLGHPLSAWFGFRIHDLVEALYEAKQREAAKYERFVAVLSLRGPDLYLSGRHNVSEGTVEELVVKIKTHGVPLPADSKIETIGQVWDREFTRAVDDSSVPNDIERTEIQYGIVPEEFIQIDKSRSDLGHFSHVLFENPFTDHSFIDQLDTSIGNTEICPPYMIGHLNHHPLTQNAEDHQYAITAVRSESISGAKNFDLRVDYWE